MIASSSDKILRRRAETGCPSLLSGRLPSRQLGEKVLLALPTDDPSARPGSWSNLDRAADRALGFDGGDRLGHFESPRDPRQKGLARTPNVTAKQTGTACKDVAAENQDGGPRQLSRWFGDQNPWRQLGATNALIASASPH